MADKNGLFNRIKQWWGNKKENKLQQLSETTKHPQENFMSKYSTKKTQEQREDEKKELQVFYKLKPNQKGAEETEYELPYFKVYMESMKEKDIKPQLEKTGDKKYLIKDDQMTEEEKYKMLYFLLEVSQNYIFVPINNFFSEEKQYEKECEHKDLVSAKIFYNVKMAHMLCSDGDFKHANEILKGELVRLFEYRKEYTNWVEGIENEWEK